MQAEAMLRAANADIGAARAAFFPSISLTGSLGTSSNSLGGLFKARLDGLELPAVHHVADLRGRQAAGQSRRGDAAEGHRRRAVREGDPDRVQGGGRWTRSARHLRDQVAALERTAAAEQRALDLAQLQFKTGVTSYLTVLTAQTGLYSAELELASTQLARLTSLVDLYRALGGGWIEHTGDAPRSADDITSPAEGGSTHQGRCSHFASSV
jgi:multidrug efflux system outer membrane protein